jgi:hypothetical protein
VARAEAGSYTQCEDAGVPEVGPADAGLEGEVERMLAGTEEGLVGYAGGRCEWCAVEDVPYARHDGAEVCLKWLYNERCGGLYIS